MPNKITMNYCAEWGSDKKATWSGTRWALEQALSSHFEITDVELRARTFSQRAKDKIDKKLGKGDFDLNRLARQQKALDRTYPMPADVWLQFSEVPMPRKGERHYIYQDLAVEWLVRCSAEDPETYRWTSFDSVSSRAMAERLALQRDFYSRAMGIFTMGKWMADYLVNEVGVSSDRVFHVGGGVNSFTTLPGERHGNTFLFAGRDYRRKGGDLVAEAFRLLHEKDPGLRLVIAGSRNNFAEGIDGVEFVGDVSNDELGKLYLRCDVFCMPSRFEAYGLVFPEAKAAGLPCVGRNAFEMPYFIQDGVNGRLVDSDDPAEMAQAMRDCLMNEGIRANAAAQADGVQAEYSWDAVADRIYQVIAGDCG